MIYRLLAREITRRYNNDFTLSCSAEILKGPLYAVIGPNGSGKSTFLRIMGLLEAPDSGEVIYQNDEGTIAALKADIRIRRNVVVVPTRAAIFNETVFSNAAYGMKLRGFTKSEVRDGVMKALQEVGLAGRAGDDARNLSSGESQRLALARALAIAPDVLMLDEPTASLDVDNARIIEDIITAQKTKGKISVLVTHDLSQAKRLADMVIFMYGGRIVEAEGAESFFRSPSSDLAGRFVSGEMS